MAEYPVNKGIGRPVEFKGLKAQYLFIFCGGLLALSSVRHPSTWSGIDHGYVSASAAASSSLLCGRPCAERPVRRTRADEIRSGTKPSPIPLSTGGG